MVFNRISILKIVVFYAVLFFFVFSAGVNGGSVSNNKGEAFFAENNSSLQDKKQDAKTKLSEGIVKLQQRAKLIDSKIEQSKAEIESIKKKEELVLNSLNEQDIAIDNIRQNISNLRKQLETINSQTVKIKENIEKLDNEIIESEKYISKRLVALYKLNRLGKIHILVSVDSVYEIIQRKMYFERILHSDKKEIDKLLENKSRLKKLHSSLNKKNSTYKSGEQSLKEQIENMSFERQKRKKLLDEIQSKKSLETAAVKALEGAAKKLDDVIKTLSAEKDGTNLLGKDSLKNPELFKGLLNLPVRGKIVSNFGTYHDPKYNIANFRSGIDIESEIGEPIRSVIPGKIIYSGWFKGYGNMIIIDHGKSFHTVYAHLEERFKAKGDVVEADEVIASAGDTGSLSGTGLYFEIRHHGKPLDPLEWFKKLQ